MMRAFLLSLLLATLAGCHREETELIVSGRIEVDDAHIGSKIGGRVERVDFQEGEDVRAGQTIVALDDRESSATLAQAKAAQRQAQAQLDLLLAGTREEDLERARAVVQARTQELQLREKGFREEEVKQAEAEVDKARSALDLADTEYRRFQTLFNRGTIQQGDLDQKRAAYLNAKALADGAAERLALYKTGSRPEEIAIAQAQLAEAQADLKRLEAGPRPEEIAAQRAAVEEARANVAVQESRLAETRILAPEDAMIETLELQPGDLIKPGEPVAVLYLKKQPWVRCYLPENRLGWVKPGDRVEVTVDTFPGRAFQGRVRRLANEAEFTPRNVQTTEKRSELVFEMKIDIVDAGQALRPGMYADVRVPRKD
ncbi:MAG: efflux RND transporter periplasmic adaptor subunit [Candidatus Sumerlaeota bacterium]|nr:efflux RND transporter periplasmic adaptor subunit [Candidatus Sumerlaeota bacterium]